MKKISISYKSTGKFSELVLDYIDGDSKLTAFYNEDPSLEGILRVAAAHPISDEARKVLQDAISRQYDGLQLSELVQQNIQGLTRPTTFTVTTGHQLCLFTGPLYFIYKVAGIINLAKKLNKTEPTKHFVPVFWMASEDHDFEEINHVWLWNQRLKWNREGEGAVGRISTEGLESVVEELAQVLSDAPQAAEILTIIRAAYKQKTLAAATRYLLHALFGKHGLLVLDGDDAALKRLAVPLFTDELSNKSGEKLVAKSSKALGEYYETKVSPRDINLFYLEDQSRVRIAKQEGIVSLVEDGRQFSAKEVADLLLHSPERFSPNVVLRPLYQELILPNVAYIGGPGEVSYWLQLKALFDHHKISYPVLLLRNSCMLLGKGEVKKMEKLGLSAENLFASEHELQRSYIAEKNSAPSLDEHSIKLQEIYSDLEALLGKTDQTLIGKVKAENAKALKGLAELEKAVIKAQKIKEGEAMGQIEGLIKKLFPMDGLQERHDNYLMWQIEFGTEFLENLIEELDPLDFKFAIFSNNG